jgi:hypothetical protein
MAGRDYVTYCRGYSETEGLRTSITTAFVTILGSTSWESHVGLGRLVDPVIGNGSGVLLGIFTFEEENLRNSTRRIHPIELEKLL